MANFKGVPTPLIRTKGIDPKAKTGALRGDVCFQLKDALTGKITDEFRGHNMLTNGLESAMNGCPFDLNKTDGATAGAQNVWKYTPIYEKLLGGLILFPQALGNDANLLFPSFANSPTGFASMDSYQQGDSRQGSYDAVSSGVITNGFRHVFSWGSAFGNGTIASLGLAPKYCEGWCSDINTRTKPYGVSGSGFVSYIATYTFIAAICDRGLLTVQKDSDNYTSTIYFYPTQRPHDIRLVQKMNGSDAWIDYDASYVPYQFSNEHRNGYAWATRIPNLPANSNLDNYWRAFNFQIIGNYVYVIFHTGANSQTFKVTRFNLSDGSLVDENTYTFSASFGDCVPVYYNGYIYAGSSTAGTIYKCNCSNVADVVEITSSAIPANAHLRFTGGQWVYNQYFILDADSDIIVANTGSSNPRAYIDESLYSANPIYDDGMWFLNRYTDRGSSYLVANLKQWGLMTHYDLQNAVVKTPDKQMEVQYSITQV